MFIIPASTDRGRIRATAAMLVIVGWTACAPAIAKGVEPVSFGSQGIVPLDRVAAWTAPKVNVDGLLAEDALNAGRSDLPYRVGFPMPADLETTKSGTWEELDCGDRLWRLRVRSDGALWIVLGFDTFRLQDGARLWIYEPKGSTVLGPFTTADVRDRGDLCSVPVDGD